MKKITTLLCGIAMAAALSTPVHAGGQSTTGSSATVPASVLAAVNSDLTDIGRKRVGQFVSGTINANGEYVLTGSTGRVFTLKSNFIAQLVAKYGA
jgi:hypothetical protein